MPSAVDPFLGTQLKLGRTLPGGLGVAYVATVDKIKERADLVHRVQLYYPFYKGIILYGSRELDSEENIGRPPESAAGIQWRVQFDFPDLFGKKKKKQ